MTDFSPTRTAALERLSAFLPKAGSTYAKRRNYDLGPDRHTEGVSTLSPYLRHRLITEAEVLEAVLARHSLKSAEKFVQEVYWRTYWKGWLEMRPGVWTAYRADLQRQLDRLKSEGGLRRMWQDACEGETGFEPFDFWAKELAQTGYLHNHARMWFASIWVFTLGLPWSLGADFFMRHLLDGDPASNTLSWRWVSGLQTKGKTYMAASSNISKYTEGRFGGIHGLAQEPRIPDAPADPERMPIPLTQPVSKDLPTALLVHSDDLALADVLKSAPQVLGTGVLTDVSNRSPLAIAPHVQEFATAAINDALNRWSDRLAEQTFLSPDAVADWAKGLGAQQIVTPYAPAGPVADDLARIETASRSKGITLTRVRKDYDSAAWPHATHGFFRFKEKIPALLGAMRGIETV